MSLNLLAAMFNIFSLVKQYLIQSGSLNIIKLLILHLLIVLIVFENESSTVRYTDIALNQFNTLSMNQL